MKRWLAGIVASACLAATASTQDARKEPAMHAKGTFEVKVIPHPDVDKAEGSTLGRMSLDKQLEGDLEATGKGQMLTAMTDVKGSAGYVAIERITGTLGGHKGSFVLQHTGTMQGKTQTLSITVVPDSGTGDLAGIEGTFHIKIDEGKHSYDFEYTLPNGKRGAGGAG